jgi:hypothetical protein
MIKLLTGAASAAVLLFVLFLESPGTALGQGVGGYRGRQGRRVGRVTLPTPPFNPDAGILNKRGGHDSPKATRRRSTRRNDKTNGHGTRRRRRVRRGRNPPARRAARGGRKSTVVEGRP